MCEKTNPATPHHTTHNHCFKFQIQAITTTKGTVLHTNYNDITQLVTVYFPCVVLSTCSDHSSTQNDIILLFLHLCIVIAPSFSNTTKPKNTIIMSYKAGISAAIADMKDRNGSSLIAIKKWMQAKLPADKKWMNTQFLQSLKSGVTANEFVQVKVLTVQKSTIPCRFLIFNTPFILSSLTLFMLS